VNLETEKQAILSVVDFWQYNTQYIVITLQLMLQAKVISAAAIAEVSR
jgi:hypothetical protein